MERSKRPSALTATAAAAEPSASTTLADGKVTATLPTGESVTVLLYGATVISWKTGGGKKECLWLSDKAKLDGSKAVRGGIPVVFPVFGKATSGPTAKLPQHGFARSSRWEFLGKTNTESSGVQLDFGLTSEALTDEFRKLWPFKFAVQYSVTLTEGALETSIVVRNEDEKPFDFQVLLHTYLQVSDISSISIEGVASKTYTDKTTDPISTATQTNPTIKISKVTDRVYKDVDQPVKVTDGSSGYAIVRDNLPDVVIWNPWEGATAMSDFGPADGYKKMVCVEPGAVASWQTLEPQDSYEGSQIITSKL